MASTPRTPRRGLPRVPGGEPWPPAASGMRADDGSGAEFDGSASTGAEAAGGAKGILQNGADLAATDERAARISSDHEDPSPDTTDSVAHADPAGAANAASATESAVPAGTPIRRGLPRRPGGDPWPPAAGPAVSATGEPSASEPDHRAQTGTAGRPGLDTAPSSDVHRAGSAEAGSKPDETSASTGAATKGVRRGLPRESGGEPWPPAFTPDTHARDAPSASVADPHPRGGIAAAASPAPHAVGEAASAAAPGATEPEGAATPKPADGAAAGAPVPRHPRSASEGSAPRPPLTVPRTVWPGAAARRAASARSVVGSTEATSPAARAGASSTAARAAGAPQTAARPPVGPGTARLGDYSPVQLLGSMAVLGILALAVVAITVLFARFVLALGPGQAFLAAYPGEYPLPASAPVGIPAWLNWSHFLNSFFLLFIIRTGWQVRNEKRPAAFWSPRKNKRRRISLTLWFHQAIDILWIANGVIFVVLLFVTGQWMRIVPTSWDVFPHALSAALQYVSLDWPTENGWVNYNSLQQLSYFAITFVAAPLAILSGVRLSGVWPKDAEKLNRLYPVEWARKVHFPVMVFFIGFIVVHVALVLATGALRNLNHMYAARGSVDADAFTTDPTGMLIFAASLVVMAAGVVAARPRVLAPIARLFGEVKQR